MIKYCGSCREATKHFRIDKPDAQCCDSCHEDNDMGYPMCELEDGDLWWSVCCGVANAVKRKQDAEAVRG